MTEADDMAFLPAAVTYLRASGTRGFAAGELVISPASGNRLRGYNLYWGNNGKKLAGYTRIAAIEVNGPGEVRYRFPEALLIPEGAEAILLFPVLYRSGTERFYEAACSAAVETGAAPFRAAAPRRCMFAVITDLHVTADPRHPHNMHLADCFAEILRRVPESLGVMCIGDTTNHGYPEEWERFTDLWENAAQSGLPPLYFAVGNHDMHFYKYQNELGYQTSFDGQKEAFLRYTRTDSATLYHFHKIDGKYFIFLGPDRPIDPGENDCYVHISEAQQVWLTALLEEAARQQAPAFLFLHQPLRETVSGSLCSADPVIQSWHGVCEDAALRAITDRFPNLIMFTGHTHWKFDSMQPVLAGRGKTASYVNAASIAYLWTDKNGNIETEEDEPELGSEGFFVEEYDDFILLRGYDFAVKKWSAGGLFLLEKQGMDHNRQPY